MENDKFSSGKSVVAFTAQNIATATTTVGEWIDTQFYGSLVVGVSIDWTAGAISAISWNEADADNKSDSAPMDDSFNLYQPGQFPIGADDVLRVGCISKKRYVQPVITTTGGSVDIDIFGMGELNNAMTQPKEINSSILETSDINIQGIEGDTIVTAPKRTS